MADTGASRTGVRAGEVRQLAATEQVREEKPVVMLTVFQRRAGRWERMRHHQARHPHRREDRSRPGNRATRRDRQVSK